MTADRQRLLHQIWTIAVGGSVLGTMTFLVFVLPLFATQLNETSLLRFPAGFYMTAQGTLLILVALIFWAAGRQETIDRKIGAADEN